MDFAGVRDLGRGDRFPEAREGAVVGGEPVAGRIVRQALLGRDQSLVAGDCAVHAGEPRQALLHRRGARGDQWPTANPMTFGGAPYREERPLKSPSFDTMAKPCCCRKPRRPSRPQPPSQTLERERHRSRCRAGGRRAAAAIRTCRRRGRVSSGNARLSSTHPIGSGFRSAASRQFIPYRWADPVCDEIRHHAAQSAERTSACSSTVRVADSCLSGG